MAIILEVLPVKSKLNGWDIALIYCMGWILTSGAWSAERSLSVASDQFEIAVDRQINIYHTLWYQLHPMFSLIPFVHLVIVWAGFASGIIQESCFIEGLQAWPYKGIAPLSSFIFWSIYFLIASPQFAQPSWTCLPSGKSVLVSPRPMPSFEPPRMPICKKTFTS